MKRVLVAVVAIAAWTGVAGYGAIQGWYLRPIAPRGDAAAFLQAATALAKAQSKGNLALVLIRQGAVYAELYTPSIDPVNRDTRFPLASMSKWFTAYAVLQLVQAGRLELDAPVASYLTQWQLPAGPFDARQVTIRRLLSHTAGLTDGLGFGDYLPSESLPSLPETLRHPRASSDSAVAIAVGRPPGPATLAAASVSGYTTAFWWAFGIFLLGAVVCGSVLRAGVLQAQPGAALAQ